MGRLQAQAGNAGARPEYLNEQGMIFGAAYASRAIVPDGTPPKPVKDPVTDYAPSARPGGRAPHVWVEDSGDGIENGRLSTIDLVGNGFVLLAAGDTPWGGSDGVGADAIADPDFAAAYELEEGGAVLVRPDGHVGWRARTPPADPDKALAGAMAEIMGHA